MKRTLTTLAVAGLALAGAAGCLLPGRDYGIRGDRARLSPAVSAALAGKWRACGGDGPCTSAMLKAWNFGEGNYFRDHGVADSFTYVAGGILPGEVAHPWPAMGALEDAANTGRCLELPTGYREGDWAAVPC